MTDNRQDQIRETVVPAAQSAGAPGFLPPLGTPDVALWRPSFGALLLSGVGAGGVLGAADGIAFHY